MLPVSLILCWWWEEAVADPTDAERSSRNYSTRYRRYLQVLGGGGVEKCGGVVFIVVCRGDVLFTKSVGLR